MSNALELYNQILSLADTSVPREVILTRLAEFEAQTAQRVKDSNKHFAETFLRILERARQTALGVLNENT